MKKVVKNIMFFTFFFIVQLGMKINGRIMGVSFLPCFLFWEGKFAQGR